MSPYIKINDETNARLVDTQSMCFFKSVLDYTIALITLTHLRVFY